jgi:methylated-DNA-[protein]-cysteine S-methyltransferase
MMTSFDPTKHGPDHTDNHTSDPGALLAALSAELTAGEGGVLARLRERLAAEAARDGTLDVGYRTLDTPVGALLLAATENGLVRVAYPREDHDAVLDTLGRLVSPRILRAPRRLDDVARQLEEYFAGTRTMFELPLDLRLSTGFRRAVLSHLSEIGYGRTASYAEVAAAAGNPKAVRAAGTACARNPLPVVLPCHRVIRSDGSAGQYVGGPEAKHALLRLERAAGGAA